MRDPTYYADVQPLLAQHCVKCHYTGGIAPFPLTTYEEVFAKANLVAAETTARRMPPWGAQDTDECVPPLGWHGDERLTEEQIGLLRRWNALDAPEGELPTEVAFASAAADPMFLASPTLEVAPKTPYLARTDRDDFRCFVIDIPELDAGAFISAVDVVPGDRRIVHHATVWSDPDGIASTMAGPDGSFDCDSSFSFEVTPDGQKPALRFLMNWAPGAKPLELSEDVGVEILPHSKIVMQIHYSVGQREIEPETTHVQLRVAQTRPKYVLFTWPIGNWHDVSVNGGDGLFTQPDEPAGTAEFRIPAWATGHVEAMQNTMTDSVPMILYGIRGHAHLAATDIKADLVHTEALTGTESTRCLLQDKWDFHWQRVYTYDAPIEKLPVIQTGDRIRLRCTYDNTTANLRLGTELYERGLQPFDIFLGESTLDEMCLADIMFLRPLD